MIAEAESKKKQEIAKKEAEEKLKKAESLAA